MFCMFTSRCVIFDSYETNNNNKGKRLLRGTCFSVKRISSILFFLIERTLMHPRFEIAKDSDMSNYGILRIEWQHADVTRLYGMRIF